MQTHGGVEAEEAILAAERQFYVEVRFDWDGDGSYDHYLTDMSKYVVEASVDRSLAGSAPQEIMLIEGSSAAELTVVLSGEDKFDELNFVSVFSPYNGFSSLYLLEPIGVEVTYRIGVETALGPIWYSQFVGNVRTISPIRQDNSVTITALDRVEKLRVPVNFTPWSLHNYWVDRGWTVAQLASSHSVIDHCLRYANVSPSPYAPHLFYPESWPFSGDIADSGTQFFLSGNGSHAPMIGWVDDARRQGYPRTEAGGPQMYNPTGQRHPDLDTSGPAPFVLNGMGSNTSGFGGFNNGTDFYSSIRNTAETRYWMRDRIDFASNATYWAGFTLDTTGPNGNWFRSVGATTYVADFFCGDGMVIRLALFQGSFRVEVRNRNSTSPFTGQVTAWRAVPAVDKVEINVRVNLVSPTSRKVSIDINGVKTMNEDIGAVAPTYGFDDHKGLIVVRHHVPISDVYFVTRWWNDISGTFNPDQFRSPAKYAAVLDEGLNKLTHFPATQYEDAWEVITSVAAAELGSVFWDEDGVFRFWNRDTVIDLQQDLVRSVSIDDVTGLSITNSLDSVRNVVSAASKYITSDNAKIYETSNADELYVPGGTVNTPLKIYIEGVESVDPNMFQRYASGGSSFPIWNEDASDSAYVVQFFNHDGAGQWKEADSLSSGVDIQAQLDVDGRLTLRVWNGYPYPARFATDGGSATLRVNGTLQTNWGEVLQQAQDDTSIRKFGKRNYALSGDWVQWQPSNITRLIDFTLARSTRPIPMTDAITMAGDPRLQLGDCIKIVDPDGLGEEMKLQIYGITRTFNRDTGLEDTLSVEMIRPAQIGVWDSAQYGIWDQTFIWS